MRILLKTTIAGPNIVCRAWNYASVSDTLGARLVEAGYAIPGGRTPPDLQGVLIFGTERERRELRDNPPVWTDDESHYVKEHGVACSVPTRRMVAVPIGRTTKVLWRTLKEGADEDSYENDNGGP